jgi:hypothetical protein
MTEGAMDEQGGRWRVPTKQERLRIHIREIIMREMQWLPWNGNMPQVEYCDQAAQKILRYLRRTK